MLPTVVAALLIAAIQVVQVTGKVLDKQLTKFCTPCEKPCGIVPVKGTFSVKIVGGENSGENEFGWIATLACNNMFMCGCIVITKKHVLTAAH
ncbi:unnamed protein product [Aphis gossypii]|uniref:Peptidase S1 domain-containing protein n=1 Tax=Aphis gossypii TaxID=80765 RepID=A0A9P0J2Q4_APHGO|nr:unnamed protein product [Aphis gossypii]